MITTTEKAEVRDLPAGEYHGMTDHISNSMLNLYRQSRRKYHARFVAKTEPSPDATPAMLLGSVTHTLILEPDEFDSRYAVAPACDRRTKAGKELWAEFCADSLGKEVIDASTAELALAMREAVMASPTAGEFLRREGRNEVSAFWRDKQSGLNCKARMDSVKPGLILDLKTARDPCPKWFSSEAANLGYHRQAESYMRGWKAATGEDCRFAFIVVGSSAPHEVGMYELTPAAIELGAAQNRSALAQLAASYRNNQWVSPWETRVNSLSLPTWAVYADEWEVLA